MPVYPKPGRGKNTHLVVVWIKGKRHDRVFHGKKAEAEAYEARLRVELEAGTAAPTRNAPHFSNFCVERFKPHAQMHLRASTWSARRYQIAALVEHFGDKRLTDFRVEDVEAYKRARLASLHKPRTINTELAVLRAIFTFAAKQRAPHSRPVIQSLPVIGRGRVTFWNDAQMASLFESVEACSPDTMGIVVFLANTGCRKGEAIAAEKSWIDMKRKLITITPSECWQPKDNEPREIPISATLLPWIERAMPTPGQWLFPAKGGGRHKIWIKRPFERAKACAGRCAACWKKDPKGWRRERCKACGPALRGGPHTLRHTFASHFLKACPDMFLLAQVLGHSETKMSKTYAHLLPAHLERARDAVNLGPAVGPAAMEARKRWVSGRGPSERGDRLGEARAAKIAAAKKK